MKKVLILLAIFVLALTSINGACIVNVDENGWLRVKDRRWEDLSSSYQEHCLKEACKSLSIDQGKVCNRKSIKSHQEELQKKIDRASLNEYPRCSTTYNKEFKIDYQPSKTWDGLSVYEKYLCGEKPKYEYQLKEVREGQALDARKAKERQRDEERKKILVLSILFIFFISLTFSYKKISRDKIKKILNNPTNKTGAVEDLKKLLQKNGYRSIATAPDKLLYKKYSFLVWCIDTVEINIKSFLPFMQKEAEELKRKSKEAETKKHKERSKTGSYTRTPNEKTWIFFKRGIFLVVATIIIQFIVANIAGDGTFSFQTGSGLLVGLPMALIFLTFVVWIYHTILASKTTQKIKDATKKATGDILKKSKSKDQGDTADILLKYHNLLQTGAISQSEYDNKKKELLG